MNNNRGRRVKIITITLLAGIIGSLGFFRGVFSYDTYVAHPNIAELAGRLYNEKSDLDITEKEIKLLSQGAVEEDMPPRWVNHFYDPVYDVGWESAYPKSVDWAFDGEAQRDYSLGDYSWQRAIYDYQNGDKEKALLALGHIIHLITDLAVPAHTRDDTHIEGDSYEQFVKYNWDILAEGLEKVDTPVIYFDNLNQHFDDLSVYTNSNFYSEGTIKSKKYAIVDEVGSERILVKDNIYKKLYKGKDTVDKTNYYIYIDERVRLGWSPPTNYGHLGDFLTLKHQLVLVDYAKHLIPKAVGHSAGIIKLFFEEVEKENDFIPNENRTSFKEKLSYLFGYAINKGHGLKGMLFGNRGVVLADKEVVAEIMSENNYYPTETQTDKDVEEIQNQIDVVEADVEDISELVAEEIFFEEPEFLPSPSLQVDQDLSDGVGTDRSPARLPDKQEEILVNDEPENNESGNQQPGQRFSFVFGPGGEQNFPVEAQSIETPQNEEDGNEEDPPSPEASEGQYTEDEEGEEEETVTSTEPIVDVTPPSIQLSIVNLQLSTSTTSTVGLSWQGADQESGVDYYSIDYKVDNGEWQVLFASTTLEDYIFEVEHFKKYKFRTQAVDNENNVSDWVEKIITTDWAKTVVINEIAWMGTASNRSSDEWIELYNNTGQDIDLSGWNLTISGKEINWDNTSSTIQANAYYLLERTNDNTVSDITADSIYKGGMKNSGENLVLSNNNGEIIDQVDNSEGWFAGERDDFYRTMERINANSPGSWQSNWQTSESFSTQGKGDGGLQIYGTPRQSNQGNWYLNNLTYNYSDLFDEDNVLTLTRDNNPYILDYETKIPDGYTLKLEEGVVMTGIDQSAELEIRGNLIAQGTEQEPIIFTSTTILNFNGEINLNYVQLIGAQNEDYESVVWIEPSQNKFSTTTIYNSIFDSGDVAVRDNTSPQNGRGAGVYLEINNSTFKNFTNPNGLIQTDRILPKLANNTAINNYKDAIYVKELNIQEDEIFNSNLEYIFDNLEISSSSTLIINPGIVLNITERGVIVVNGRLSSLGTVGDLVVIKSLDENKYWGSMLFNNSTSTLEYTNLRGGNLGAVSNPHKNGILWMDNSNVTLNNVTLADARRPYNMIYAEDSDLSISNSLISWSEPKQVSSWNINGIKLKNSDLYLDNTYFNQMDWAVVGDLDSTVELQNMTPEHLTNVTEELNW